MGRGAKTQRGRTHDPQVAGIIAPGTDCNAQANGSNQEKITPVSQTKLPTGLGFNCLRSNGVSKCQHQRSLFNSSGINSRVNARSYVLSANFARDFNL